MSPRHPLSQKPNQNQWHVVGGIILLLLLALSIRWARGPVPTVVPPGITPGSPVVAMTPGPTPVVVSPVLPQTAATPYSPVVAPVVAPTNPAISQPFVPTVGIAPAVSPVPAISRVLPPFWKVALPTAPVCGLARLANGTVWAAVEDGLVHLENGAPTFFTRSNGFFPAKNTTCLAHDGTSVWVGTYEGLFQTVDGRTYKQFTQRDGLAHDMVWTLEWDAPTRLLWIGTQNGFSFLDAGGKLQTVNQEISNGGLADLWIGALKRFDRWALCGNDDGLSIWNIASMAADPNSWVTLDMFNSAIAHNWILSMAVTGAADTGKLWVGTPLGVSRLDSALDKVFAGTRAIWRTFAQSDGLPSSRADVLLADGNDLWVGTPEGLARLRDSSVKTFRYADGLLASDVRALAMGQDGLWVGTSMGIQLLDITAVK
jgi:ligand-binding sensor domain-containing protein